ncbi:MAG: SMP-30/gluconolactonase/LRE family protein [Bryobacteraceae bacterium]|nr:SMP-30/gluconolactonase/LRE family protein [Bryobacteraceae bacterium]
MNAARWVRERGFQNVLLEIANEYPHNGFVHQVIRDPKGQAGLIRLAKETAPGLLVSASGYGDGRIHREVAEAADFLLPHWNGTKVEHIPARIAALKPFGKPIVCNEDDKTGAEAVAALRACVDHGASYGLMLKARNQTFPFRFDGAADDPVFYAGLSGLVARPERPGAGGAVLPGRSGDAAGAKEPGRPASGSVHRKTLPVGTRPESVTKGFGGHYYVTVMGGQQPGDAVIKVIKGDQVEVFATGLDEPKGIAFVGGFLVTTDLKRVWKIDARGNKTVLADEKDFPKPISYLNDAAAAPDGQGVFVTDMGARDKIMGPDGLWPTDSPEAKAVPAIGRVYHLSLDGRVRLAVDAAPAMTCPNGVCAPAPDHLLIAEFFHGNLLQARHGSVQVLNTGFRGADGIERAKSGRIFVSSWTQGKVWRLDEQGQNPEVLIEGLQSAADFYLDEPARLLLVPDMKAGLVVWVPLE